MAAILLDLNEGDEIILPSYTFVSTATPFALLGAKPVFCDSTNSSPNISAKEIAPLITASTKAIVVVHYAGLACDMDAIMELAEEHGIVVIEDAAHAITAKYKDRYLGTIGHMAAISFHETKNVSCGQGGMLIVNDERLVSRAEKVWAKGTNRLDMERGLVHQYEWVDLGSNFYPSEISVAVLYAQLEEINEIQAKRKAAWEHYAEALGPLDEKGYFKMAKVEGYQSNNYHIFYLLCKNQWERDALISFLKGQGALALFHYLPLHKSPYVQEHDPVDREFPNAERYADTVIRLPLFAELHHDQIAFICRTIRQFFVLNRA